MVELTHIGKENVADYIGFFPPDIAEKAFRSKNRALLMGIEDENTAVGGMAILFDKEKTRLCWLEIAPSQRHRGCGGEALYMIMRFLKSCGVKTMSTVVSPEDDEAFSRLLRGYPFTYTNRPEGLARCTVEDFHVFPRIMKPAKYSVPLSSVPPHKLNKLCQSAVKLGLDFVPMPIISDEYEQDLSAVLIEKNEPAGLLLVQEYEPGKYCIPLFFGLTKNPAKLMDMACYTRSAADRLLSPNAVVEVAYVNPALEKMLMARADLVDVNILVKAKEAVISLDVV